MDPVMTAAMIDRITHKSYKIHMNGNSYRLKENQDWLKNQIWLYFFKLSGLLFVYYLGDISVDKYSISFASISKSSDSGELSPTDLAKRGDC